MLYPYYVKAPLLYRILCPFVASLYDSLLYREAYGAENVPTEGPCILASNHVSYLDPPAIGSSLYREVFFLSRPLLPKRFLKTRLGAWLLKSLNLSMIQGKWKAIEAVKSILNLLAQESCVLIFLEGTRSSDGTIQKAKDGIGLLACRTHVPVVPARVFGAYEILNRHHTFPDIRHPMDIVYGAPLSPEDYDPGKDHPYRYTEAARRIIAAIADLKPPPIPCI